VVDQVRAICGPRTPLVVVLGGGYGHGAWRYSARFLAWLVRGKAVEPPDDMELTLRRHRSAFAGLDRALLAGSGSEWALTADDLLGGDPGARRESRVLSRYAPQGVELLLEHVGINPTRTGAIDILKSMGGNIELIGEREVSGEPVADILVHSSQLKGIDIAGSVVPRAIDEFPAICVAAACAEGRTTIRDARELRVKETDRIAAMATNLRQLGVEVNESDDGMDITGVEKLGGGKVKSFGDHRIAMSLSIAALASANDITVDDTECVATSFPSFFPLLEKVSGR